MELSMPTICKLCTVDDDNLTEIKQLYEKAFPADERDSTEQIRKLMSQGKVLLHKTVHSNGELLCFSLSSTYTNFVLLEYIATNPDSRSGGYGSKHLKKLLEIFRAEYPHYLGLFIEIESTREKGLDAKTNELRKRRLYFYQRLGAKRLCRSYLIPNISKPNTLARKGELLWVAFGEDKITDEELARIIKEIYVHAYYLDEDNPNVRQVLGNFTKAA